MAEHNGVADEQELNGIRTVIPFLLDRFLIPLLNVRYRLEHHFFPSVPWPNQRRLRVHLMTDPVFAADAHIMRGYWGLIEELMRPPASTSTNLLLTRPE